MSERWVQTRAASEECGVPVRTLYRLVRDGVVEPAAKLPGRRGRYLWNLDNLREQLRRVDL